MSTLDVLVVGAGPAGVAAALEARTRGLSALVVDKARFPRDKTCGDGLTAGALRRLEALGVDVPGLARHHRIDEAVVVSPSGRQVELPLPNRGEFASVVPRQDLDAALLDRALAAGVTVREGAAVTSVAADSSSARVGLSTGEAIRASYVVAADGHYSAVRRLVTRQTTPELGTWHAFRQYFRCVLDSRLWVLFERDLLPGYVWVFPLPGGRANVGFGVVRHSTTTGRGLARIWAELLGRPRVRAILGPDAEAEDSHRAWPIPASYDPGRLAAGRVLFAGDAAGVVDPMTGEGIAEALETGALAAAAIAGDGAPAVVGAAYRRSVQTSLGRDLQFAARLQRVLSAPLGARGALRIVDLNDWTRRSFARWMFEDYPRALVLTPTRWQRGRCSGPGAYAARA